MKRIMTRCYFVVIFIILSTSQARSGECLQSDEDMYLDMLAEYQSAINRIEYDGGHWSISQCWDGNDNELNGKLDNLIKTIIKDDRLDPSKKFEAITLFDFTSKEFNDKKFKNIIKTSLNDVALKVDYRWSEALTLLTKYFDPYDSFIKIYYDSSNGNNKGQALSIIREYSNKNDVRWLKFLKNEAIVEKDTKHKRELIFAVREYSNYNIKDFMDYLDENKFYDMQLIINDNTDYVSLIYAFERLKLNIKPNNISDNEQLKHYFSYSNSIFNVLKKNLQNQFPDYILMRMRPQELRLLRNGILAYYGKNFKSKQLQYYYYGDYENITSFCMSNVCGTSKKRKNVFKESSLNDVDLKNIAQIEAAEKIVAETGYNFSQYIENYDYDKFQSRLADNLTITSNQLRRIFQVRLDWPNKRVWVWDSNGVSGWNLRNGSRIYFAKGAKGPIDFSSSRNIVSYLIDGNIVVKSFDKDITYFYATIENYEFNNPNNIINIFSPNGDQLIYSTKRKIFVLDLVNNETKTVPLVSVSVNGLDIDGSKVHIHPSCFVDDGKMLMVYILTDESQGFAVINLHSPDNSKVILYGSRHDSIYALAVDENYKYLYIDYGFKKMIDVYSVDEILSGSAYVQPYKKMYPGNEDYRYIRDLFVVRGKLIRADTGYVGFVDIEDNNSNSKTIQLDYGVPDIYSQENIYAIGHREGYIVVRRLPF